MRFSILLVFLVVAPALGAPAWGTSSNFDGEDPLCWTSAIATDKALNTTLSDIDVWEEETFNQNSTNLRSKCFPCTQFSVEPLDLDEDQSMLTQNQYTFRIQLGAVLKFIDQNIIIDSTFTKGYVRLIMCDALKRGFCNPLDDLRDPLKGVVDSTNDKRYAYTQGDPLTAVSDGQGAVVFSRWVQWKFKTNGTQPSLEEMYTLNVDITLELPKGTRRAPYFFIGHAVLTFDVKDQNHMLRIDIADAVPDNIVQVRDPPVIDRVSDAMRITVLAATGFFSFLVLGALLFVVFHRKHAVMKLAQAHLLAAFIIFNLIPIAASFSNIPTQDVFCQISGPLILIPLTAVGAIMVARTWRIYTTLASALSLGKAKKDDGIIGSISNGLINTLSLLAKFPFFGKKPDRRTLRSTVPEQETYMLAFILTLPQIILQVIFLSLDQPKVYIDLSEDRSIGREVCETNDLELLCVAITAIPCVIAIWLSWVAKDLPSVFNEKDQVFAASGSSIVVAIIAFTLLLVLDDPSLSVDLTVFLRCLMSIGIPIIMVYYMVWPKIKRVLSGEKVVVSSLFAPKPSLHSEATQSTEHETENNDVLRSVSGSKVHSFVTRVKLEKDDPLPITLERSSLEVHKLLGNLSRKSSEGRTLSSGEWKTLQTEVARLKMHLDEVELAWNDDEVHVDDI